MANKAHTDFINSEVHKHVSIEESVKFDTTRMYDKIAVQYEKINYDDAGRRKAFTWGIEQLKDNLSAELGTDEPIRCIDLGCASGRPSMEFLSEGISKITSRPIAILGVDPSLQQIKFGQSYGIPNTKFVQADMRAFEPAHGPESVDLIVSVYALNHLSIDHIKEILPKIASWLKPPTSSKKGGIFVLGMVANAFGVIKFLNHDVVADSFLNLDEGRQICEASGFEVFKTWEEEFYPTEKGVQPKVNSFYCCRRK